MSCHVSWISATARPRTSGARRVSTIGGKGRPPAPRRRCRRSPSRSRPRRRATAGRRSPARPGGVPSSQRVRVAHTRTLGRSLEEAAPHVGNDAAGWPLTDSFIERSSPQLRASAPSRAAASSERFPVGDRHVGRSPAARRAVESPGRCSRPARFQVSMPPSAIARSGPRGASAAPGPRASRCPRPAALAHAVLDEPDALAHQGELQPVPHEPRHVASYEDGHLAQRGDGLSVRKPPSSAWSAPPRSPRRSASGAEG